LGIRIKCTVPGHEEDWIEFKERGWTLGDRRRFGESRDIEALEMIVRWAVDWRLTDANGQLIPFTKELGIKVFDDLDMAMYPWLVASAYEAFARASVLPPKKNSRS